MLGQEETYKNLRILEADTTKEVETKEKFEKSISEERGLNLKPNYVDEI